jgi:Zn-dependent protease/predicted transcriptional regulator
MRKGSLSLGSVAGIQLYIHWSFLIVIGYVGFTAWKDEGTISNVLFMIGFVMSVFACVLLHELGHALMAKRYQIDTTDITLLPIGGLARLARIPEVPKQELWVALAGPAVNVAIAIVLIGVALLTGVFSEPLLAEGGVMFNSLLLNLVSANVVLVIFNMIPAFPMDGGRVLRAILAMLMNRVKATRIAAVVGQILAVGFAAYAIYAVQPMLGLIGVFVFFGARMEASAVKNAAEMKGLTVAHAMRSKYVVLQASDTVTRAVQELLAGGDTDFVVMDGEHLAGLVSRDALVKAVADHLAGSPVSVITKRDVAYVTPDEELKEAQLILRTSSQGFLPVIDNGKLVGVVDAANIAELLLIREAAGV